MSELQTWLVEENGETYEIYMQSTDSVESPPSNKYYEEDEGYESKDAKQAMAKMQQAQKMIRGYAMYAVSAFKNFGAAEIEEVTLKFGMKIGGKAGIPYITQGTAESNLEIEVKCKFPS